MSLFGMLWLSFSPPFGLSSAETAKLIRETIFGHKFKNSRLNKLLKLKILQNYWEIRSLREKKILSCYLSVSSYMQSLVRCRTSMKSKVEKTSFRLFFFFLNLLGKYGVGSVRLKSNTSYTTEDTNTTRLSHKLQTSFGTFRHRRTT